VILERKEVEGLVDWRAEQRVVVGGSFENNFVAGRLTARRPADVEQSTGAMGFRCAASTLPGVDVASLVLRDDLPPGTRPQDVEFDVKRVIPIEQWTSSAGTAVRMGDEGPEPVPGYARIESYEHVLYLPSDKIETITVDRMTELSYRNGTVTMGVLVTTKPLSWPPLDRGTYVVAYRAAGEPIKTMKDIEDEAKAARGKPAEAGGAKPSDEPVASDALGFAPPPELPKDAAHFLFFTPDGVAKAWIPAPSMSYVTPSAPKVTIVDQERQWQTRDENGKVTLHKEPGTKVTIQATSKVQVSNKGVTYPLELWFPRGSVGASWRHP
jgi:hypothetical protein